MQDKNKERAKYPSLENWMKVNGYEDAQYISGFGWYAIRINSCDTMPVPICPPGYFHDAIKEYKPLESS